MPDGKLRPLISIITPSYNQAAYLEATIRSVLEQDYSNIEYMVIDGGANDGSRDIIKRYAEHLAYWVSEADEGQADAINKGFARASGKYVAWLNSDDVYRPGAVSRAVEMLEADHELGLVYGQLDSIDAQGKVFNTITYQNYDLLDMLAFRIIGQPSVFMRRTVLDEAGSLDLGYKYLLDHHLWIRMAQQSKMTYVPEVWAAARHHESAKNVAQAAGFGAEAYRILEWAQGNPELASLIEQNQRKVRAGAYRLDARYLLDGGEFSQSMRAYWQAFSQQPGYALQHWKRILYALAGVFGIAHWLDRLR
ncbi:MAG: glycosyltransferase [Chloroflexi bacterium]|nr:MAG: glycosyltransferase [Chloroflexota bacterium]MBL1194311.1 glycosyltransferase [Chloroflexota bacterium]NOH11601.1 glycosyltransferase [Chloroflexota bacterium]